MGGKPSSSLENCCRVCSRQVHSGLKCNAHSHLICSRCLSSYVTEYCESGHSLAVASGFIIHCPVQQCTSHLWQYCPLTQQQGSEVLETYVDSLLYFSIITLNKPRVNYYFRVSLALKIVSAMKLHCPGCGVAMVKVRGMSCSAECRQCGTHFCWLCFKVNSDRETCRTHVMMCHLNPFKVLYPPVYCVEAVHCKHKIKFVRMIIEEVTREAHLISGSGLRIEADLCAGVCFGFDSVEADEHVKQVMDMIESVLIEVEPILMDNGIKIRIK